VSADIDASERPDIVAVELDSEVSCRR